MSNKVTLHTVAHIENNLVQELSDGSKHTNRVAFKKDIIATIPADATVTMLVSYPEGGDYYAFEVTKSNGNPTRIHPSWIKSINGTEISIEKDNTKWGDGRKKRVKLNSTYIFSHAEGLVAISTLPVCSCGNPNVVYESGSIRLCQSCVDEATKLKNYSYRPTPDFTGSQITADVDNPVWYGIELEYGFNGRSTYNDLLLKHSKELYAKSDSSISGGDFRAEIVSHPHSFTELMKSTSFINSLADINVADTANTRNKNGCHVHISRTAFVDDKHYAKWYFLIHQMKDINEFIGGRSLTNYCKFSPNGKIHSKENKSSNTDRSLMVNETNQATVECRFFTGTKDVDSVKVYVQYLESLIKYTKYAGDTVSTADWLTYVKRKTKKYAQLITKMESCTLPTNQSVEYRAPVKTMEQWANLTMGQVAGIAKIKVRGEWISFYDCQVNRDRLRGTESSGNNEYMLVDIQEVEIHS